MHVAKSVRKVINFNPLVGWYQLEEAMLCFSKWFRSISLGGARIIVDGNMDQFKVCINTL